MISKNMTNLEEFFKNRITFKLCEKHGRFFYSSHRFEYLSNNIFTPEEYSLKNFFKEKVKAFAYYLFSCYLLNYRQRIIRGERTTDFKGGIEIYGDFFDDIEDYKIPMIKLELTGDYFDTVKILNFFDSYLKLKGEQFWVYYLQNHLKLWVDKIWIVLNFLENFFGILTEEIRL